MTAQQAEPDDDRQAQQQIGPKEHRTSQRTERDAAGDRNEL
jgi:hypothetical protein